MIRSLIGWLVCCAGGVLLLASCDSPIVGAECRTGFTLCGDICVNLREDFRNCGMCGHGCGRFVCQDGTCSKTQLRAVLDGSVGDGAMSLPDAGNLDGSIPVGGPDAGRFNPDAGLGGCRLGEQECGGVCSNPAEDRDHCGTCDKACDGTEFCSAGVCAAQCKAPLLACAGRCRDLSEDANHCGTCSTICTSGICESGHCADAVAGQAVVIGHDFTSGNNAMQRLAGNAVFLARGAPVRVLVYRGEASDESVSGVEAAINQVRGELGRDWRKIEAVELIVPLQLATADALLVHAQANARNSTLLKLGQQWGNALAQFVATGGVIVLFEAPSTQNDGTWRVLEPAQIFVATNREMVASQQLKVLTPGLGVAVRVPDRYMSATNTVHFRGVKTPGSFVVVDKDNLPVLIQRVIVP